ncbi:hypothetical protein J6590_076287 [Homalodisca vitripennis]|nr:hypothetical protein J6590_076287 [Homalodisca vitripennis]
MCTTDNVSASGQRGKFHVRSTADIILAQRVTPNGPTYTIFNIVVDVLKVEFQPIFNSLD